MRQVRFLVAVAALSALPRAEALNIVFNDVGPSSGYQALSNEALAGFQAAASQWEALIANDVTVRIDIACYDFGAGQSNIIGQAGSYFYSGAYAEIRGAWAASATSAVDAAVMAGLPAGDTYTRLVNLATDLPNPAETVLAAADSMWINGGNAKAMGLLPADNATVDAQIEFNSAFAFDYNRADGIAGNQMDFIGVAAHEIGHALGFISVVDYLDGGLALAEALSMPMDLLRYSAQSYSLGVTDISIDAQPRYLVIGKLGIQVSTGVIHGDGQQAAHFIDNAGLGMMDPTAAYGELRVFSPYDLVVMDALGWQLTAYANGLAQPAIVMAVPEPSTYGLTLGGVALALAASRRRKGR